MEYSAKDLITEYNVTETYQENKYICFVLKNGFKVKLNPNEADELNKNRSK